MIRSRSKGNWLRLKSENYPGKNETVIAGEELLVNSKENKSVGSKEIMHIHIPL